MNDGGDETKEPRTHVSNSGGFAYKGPELEAMGAASNYHRWILAVFKPFLGRHVVEVGAGLGAFSELILSQHPCETLSLVEPSDEMHGKLAEKASRMDTTTRVETYHANFVNAAPLIKAKQAPDSVIYVNVLEHIADDEFELETVRQNLSEGGCIFLFVPALQWLYGVFDERVGHVRRYTKRELEDKLERSGFNILLSSYFDLAGVAPWWIKYRLLKSATMGERGVRFYDRFIVPAARRIESVASPPIGKNVIVIAQKS